MSHAVKPRKAKSHGQSTSGESTKTSPPPASTQSEMLQRWQVESAKSNLPINEWRLSPQDAKTKETKGKF